MSGIIWGVVLDLAQILKGPVENEVKLQDSRNGISISPIVMDWIEACVSKANCAALECLSYYSYNGPFMVPICFSSRILYESGLQIKYITNKLELDPNYSGEELERHRRSSENFSLGNLNYDWDLHDEGKDKMGDYFCKKEFFHVSGEDCEEIGLSKYRHRELYSLFSSFSHGEGSLFTSSGPGNWKIASCGLASEDVARASITSLLIYIFSLVEFSSSNLDMKKEFYDKCRLLYSENSWAFKHIPKEFSRGPKDKLFKETFIEFIVNTIGIEKDNGKVFHKFLK